MSKPTITPSEIDAYWNIFATRTNNGTHMTGEQAAPVLKNSGLSDNQLERVWDLADVDGDGNLDFEEFCVAMRVIYDILNGVRVLSAQGTWLELLTHASRNTPMSRRPSPTGSCPSRRPIWCRPTGP